MSFYRRTAFTVYVQAALLTVVTIAAVLFFGTASAFPASSEQDMEFLESGPGPASGNYRKQALLTVFYNAGTNGELHPCPT